MALWLGAAAGFLAGAWLGSHPDPEASRSAKVLSRAITGCIGMFAGAVLSSLAVPAAMPPWPETVEVASSAADLDAIVGSADPGEAVLVDFYATWCGPCRSMAPNVIALSESGVRVAVVDVDLAPEAAMRFGVEALPTVIVFVDGRPVRSAIGYHSTEELRALAAG